MAKPLVPVFNADATESGEVFIFDMPRFKDWIRSVAGRVQVTVRKPERLRTIRQNNYLFGVVYKMMEEANGNTKAEWHEAMKMLFNKKALQVGKYVIEIADTSTTMSTREFSEFVENIRRFASDELGISIPDPSEVEV